MSRIQPMIGAYSLRCEQCWRPGIHRNLMLSRCGSCGHAGLRLDLIHWGRTNPHVVNPPSAPRAATKMQSSGLSIEGIALHYAGPGRTNAAAIEANASVDMRSVGIFGFADGVSVDGPHSVTAHDTRIAVHRRAIDAPDSDVELPGDTSIE